MTVTFAFALIEPPAPVQVIAYAVVSVRTPVETPVALFAALPVEKPPAATQDEAFDDDQYSVVDWPASIVSGFAHKLAVGTGGGGGGGGGGWAVLETVTVIWSCAVPYPLLTM